jgi:hypothetical protein
LAGSNFSAVAQGLQGRNPSDRQSGGLLKVSAFRLEREPESAEAILRERAAANADNVIAGLEAPSIFADDFHFAGDINSEPQILRPVQAGFHAHNVGNAAA